MLKQFNTFKGDGKPFPLLHSGNDLVRDRLHRRLGFGVVAGAGRFFHRHFARHTRTPLVVVAKLALLQTVARIGDAQALFDLEQVLELRR